MPIRQLTTSGPRGLGRRLPPVMALVLSSLLCAAWQTPGAGHTTRPAEHGRAGDTRHQHGRDAAPGAGGPDRPRGGDVVIPDVLLSDQEGRPVRLYSDLIKGKVVAINFIFTTCTGTCPQAGAVFSAVRKKLGGRPGREVFLISVTVDPVTDTPERLKAWGAKFGAGPGWTLVTGDKQELNRLLKPLLGRIVGRETHSPVVILGDDARGVWTREHGLSPPEYLIRRLREMSAAGGK